MSRHCRRSGVQFKVEATPARTRGQAAVWVPLTLSDRFVRRRSRDRLTNGVVQMTTINRKVIDIYHGNSVNSWSAIKAAGILGVIHKATEGTANVDSKYADRKIQALNTGLLWGAYHFAHAGNVQAQVDHFLSVAGIDDQTLYALDWEDTPAGTMSLGEAHQFLQLVDQKVGANRCVVYSENSINLIDY